MKKSIFLLGMVFVLSILNVAANKTSVVISVPDSAKAGEEITIVINVSHSANSGMHHTDWVYLKINDVEVKRWEYSKDNLPPDADFTVEFKYTVPQDADIQKGLMIEAEGHCNIHGSAGPADTTVVITGEKKS